MTANSKIDSHFSKFYDEKQLVDRYRISFETLLLMSFLIIINGVIKISHGPFAAPEVEMGFLFSLPFTYFMVRSIIKEAYFTKTNKSKTFAIATFVLLGIVLLFSPVMYLVKGGPIIENGVIVWAMANVFFALPFISTPIAYLIQKMTQKNVEEDEE